MLYNFNWLKQGELFPPRTEIPRMKSYRDNEALFFGDSHLVLDAYLKRLHEIIVGLKEKDNVSMTFFDIPNYWQLISLKTADLTVGESPVIKCKQNKDALNKAIEYSDLFNKLTEMVFDIDSLGDCVVVPYIDELGFRTFSVNNPALWLPIVNPENVKEVLYDCICWTVCVQQDVKYPLNSKYELHCKVQKRGEMTYTLKKFSITSHQIKEYIHAETDENCGNIHFFRIGKQISEEIKTAPYKQAVIQFPGITTSRNIYGISNYERVTSIVGEIAIREALASFILDENSAPRMASPEGSFVKNKDGRWVLKTGGKNFVVKPGESPPIYVTWDGNLTSNEARIVELKKELYAMSEMGTIISHDDLNSSQGFDALDVKMTNPKLKARRICTRLQKPLKELLRYLINSPDADIDIIFKYGLPPTKTQKLDMAIKERTIGKSKQTVFVEYCDMSEENAEQEVEKALEEEPNNPFMGGFTQQNGLHENNNTDDGLEDEER